MSTNRSMKPNNLSSSRIKFEQIYIVGTNNRVILKVGSTSNAIILKVGHVDNVGVGVLQYKQLDPIFRQLEASPSTFACGFITKGRNNFFEAARQEGQGAALFGPDQREMKSPEYFSPDN